MKMPYTFQFGCQGHRGVMDLGIVLQLHDRNQAVIWCPDHGNSNAIAFREFYGSVHG